ncbi:MAG: TRAP transporter small permease subunit [Sedimenticolaceae bacterium]|nr:TRAP transporter small permease subunit [Sedimenticolaceae bacterium]
MPELSFVMPHWLYWSGLVFFPLAAWFIVRRTRARSGSIQPLSLIVGYFLLVAGGFVGCHRLYVKSKWAIAFILVFVTILFVNIEVREARDGLSSANNAVSIAESKIKRAEKNLERGRKNAQEKLDQALVLMEEAKTEQDAAVAFADRWEFRSRALAVIMLLLLLADALLLPGLVRKRNSTESLDTAEPFVCPAHEPEHDPSREPFAYNRLVGRINGFTGEFVAYWSMLAVFVYYYEVIARYVFNSPTNWAHESMFLMFGMQYLLAGGYTLREGSHVRVDVIYTHLSERSKAIMDLITSVFFFIFVITLLVTGWIFFHDSFAIKEVSFTEWGIQYYPVKFALPLGAALILLQGIAILLKDIHYVLHPPPEHHDESEEAMIRAGGSHGD